MKRHLSLVIFLFAAASIGSHAQGIFLKIGSQYDIVDLEFESPFQDRMSFDDKVSWQAGRDLGYVVQPRRLNLQLRFSTGLHYHQFELKAKVTPGTIGEDFIVNESFDERYDMLTVPVRFEMLLKSKYSRIAPGMMLALNNNFSGTSTVTSRLVDGSTLKEDIETESYIPSISGGLFLGIVFSRSITLEFAAGYTRMLASMVKDGESTLKIHAFNAGASLVIQLQ